MRIKKIQSQKNSELTKFRVNKVPGQSIFGSSYIWGQSKFRSSYIRDQSKFGSNKIL